MRLNRFGMISVALLSGFMSSAFAADEQTVPSYSPYAASEQPRNVYWGDTHLHTTYSPDAGLTGNTSLTPGDAYRFALGEEVKTHNGMVAKLNRPLDFLVVSDHAEYLGLIPNIRKSDPALLKNTWGKRWHDMFKAGDASAYKAAIEVVNSMAVGDEKIKDESITRSAWQVITGYADQYNDPGKFTAFIGYEWTSMPNGGNNLHRVVIFKDDAKRANQILPFSAFDSEDPEDLWAFMEEYETSSGGHVLALGHNGNVSNGLMFSDKDFKGKPLTPAYAETRARWEPLYEVTQMKGDGETHPYLSPEDQFADYETWDKGSLLGNAPKTDDMLQYEYGRSALKLGLKLESQLGVNPFKVGFVGSTDAHTALATSEENNQWGKITLKEPSSYRAESALIKAPTAELTTWGYEQAASGYAAVWAKENTRAAIFEAMQRRETYATTGPRMTVRFFGGWDFDQSDVMRPNFADFGYAKGVPMGGDLAAAPAGKAPQFMVQASRDPDGANLDRVQVIKGWLDRQDVLHEKVYDVALSDQRKAGASVASIGSTIDSQGTSYTNTIGSSELATVWVDPDFDLRERAFYYARVIQIPTPRWTSHDEHFFNNKMPKGTKMTTQERAYTSPIWYTP